MYIEQSIFNSQESIGELEQLLNPFWMIRQVEQLAADIHGVLEKLLAAYLLSYNSKDLELNQPEKGESATSLVRIILASTNPRKRKGIEAFQDHFNSIYKMAKILEVIPVRVPGKEPDAANASAVAKHKVATLIATLTSDFETSPLKDVLNHRNLIIASDVVVKVRQLAEQNESAELNENVEGKHLLNLSRITDAGEKVHVQKFIQNLHEQYANGPFELTYEIANAASMVVLDDQADGPGEYLISPEIKVSAVRVKVQFAQLPSELIHKHFNQLTVEEAGEEELKNAGIDPGINVGLPLFDEGSPFVPYITHVSVTPIGSDQGTAINVSELNQEDRAKLFNALKHWITYGIVPSAAELIMAIPS